MTFPRFDHLQPLDGERSWVAVYDSYDQRNDDVYYVITVHSNGHDACSTARVSLWWAGDDWTGPQFADRLRDELRTIARTM